MSVESPRQQHPPSTPSNPSPTPSETCSSSSINDEEVQQQSAKLHLHREGQPGSASPPANNPPPPSAVAPPPSVIIQQSKPKSVKHRKSPSPLPVVHPPPLQTIRLDIKLGGPDNYEVDITALSLDEGQRAPTPTLPLVEPDSSDSEKDSDGHVQSKTPPHKDKKGKKRIRNAEYDLTDPFIDNSDLGIDDRTHFPQTKQKGFYVSNGEVALLVPSKSPRNPRSVKPLVLTSSATANIQPLSQTVSRPRTPPVTKDSEGTADSPILLVDDEGPKSSLKRDRSASPHIAVADAQDSETNQKRSKKARPSASTDASVSPSRAHKHATSHSFSDELEASFDALKIAIAEENWEAKGRFPPSMKPKLRQLALQAIVQGEYDGHFFARMPLIFPYNKFTMTKLIKRLVYNDHHKLLITRQEESLAELKELADAGFEQARLEWEKNVQNWKERIAKDSAVVESTNHPDDTVDDHDDQEKEAKEGTGSNGWSGKDTKEKEPQKKYRLTEKMKSIFWELYCLSNECSRLTNEKNQLEGILDVISEQGMRKALYQKIVTAFPEGWMTSGNISRDISVIKKKHETEQNRYDEYS